MKLRNFSFIGMVVLVVGALQILSFVNKPPAMPKDIHHTTVSRDARAQCLRCHRAEAMLALEQANRHPEKWRAARSDCLLCHITAGGAKRKAEPIVARPLAPFSNDRNVHFERHLMPARIAARRHDEAGAVARRHGSFDRTDTARLSRSWQSFSGRVSTAFRQINRWNRHRAVPFSIKQQSTVKEKTCQRFWSLQE